MSRMSPRTISIAIRDRREVVHAAGGEVVEDDDLVPLAHQKLGDVSAYEPGPAGYHELAHVMLRS